MSDDGLGIVDYGVGNLHSLAKALSAAGGQPRLVASPQEVERCGRLVLPGVGAFGAAAAGLDGLRTAILRHAGAGRPLLGVCLGMQLLFQASEESPGAAGLGLLPGTVRRLRHPIVPAIGWNEVRSRDPLVADGEHYYFVHGYAAPVGPDTIAVAEHGEPFSAAVRRGNVAGVQFHPEKSGAAGLALLRRWLA